jgi:hypothetical protein
MLKFLFIVYNLETHFILFLELNDSFIMKKRQLNYNLQPLNQQQQLIDDG